LTRQLPMIALEHEGRDGRLLADSVAKVFWAIERATLIRRRHRP
jgi:hypothetical protein